MRNRLVAALGSGLVILAGALLLFLAVLVATVVWP